MKKILVLFIMILMISSSSSFADNDEIKLVVAGNTVQTDTKPLIIQGRTFVPIRAITESLKSKVEWNSKTPEVTLTFVEEGSGFEYDIENVKMKINVKEYIADGKKGNMEIAPKIINGRTMIPLRFLGELLGCEVDWENNTRTVLVSPRTSEDAEKNEKETILYHDNGIIKYKGEVKNGLPHGKGKWYGTEWNMIQGTRSVVNYDGEWKDGRTDGFGIYYLTGAPHVTNESGYIIEYIGYSKNGERFGAGANFFNWHGENNLLFIGIIGNYSGDYSTGIRYTKGKPSSEVIKGIVTTNEVSEMKLPFINEVKIPNIIYDVDKVKDDINIQEIINVLNQYQQLED